MQSVSTAGAKEKQYAELEERTKVVRKASYIALAGNLVLCLTKIAAGLFSGSLAVLGDGLDSASDVAIACMALIVSFVINRPSDPKHPWGHQRAETVASVILTFIIMLAGIQLFLAAMSRLIQIMQGRVLPMPEYTAIAVTVFSIAGKLFLAFNQYMLGKKANSAMIAANARNMLNDIIISTSVLLGFGLSFVFTAPYFDTLIALLVACWIMKSAVSLFIELNIELMDGTVDGAVYRDLFDAVKTVPEAKNPHRARMRKMANLWDIDLDIEVDGNLTVREAHSIAERTAAIIKQKIGNVYDIVIHIEPYNSNRDEESYGLSPTDAALREQPYSEPPVPQ